MNSTERSNASPPGRDRGALPFERELQLLYAVAELRRCLVLAKAEAEGWLEEARGAEFVDGSDKWWSDTNKVLQWTEDL